MIGFLTLMLIIVLSCITLFIICVGLASIAVRKANEIQNTMEKFLRGGK